MMNDIPQGAGVGVEALHPVIMPVPEKDRQLKLSARVARKVSNGKACSDL